MGGARAPAGGAALEFSQVSDRPRRPPEGRIYLRGRAQRPARDRGHRKGIGRRLAAGPDCLRIILSDVASPAEAGFAKAENRFPSPIKSRTCFSESCAMSQNR